MSQYPLISPTETSPPYKHDQEAYDGDTAEYSYEPMAFFRGPLTRQINEGVRINSSLGMYTLMNSKAEFRRGSVPRVEVMRGLRD